MMNAKVISVSKSKVHGFSKAVEESITLIEDYGVEGDAHAGKKIQHVFLAKEDPERRNIRQVHLIASELFSDLSSGLSSNNGDNGFSVSAGQLGENITTQGIDLLSLFTGTRLHIGNDAIVELTALRHPCIQIEEFQKGLLKRVVHKNSDGKIVRKVGVMGIVLVGGVVKSNDDIIIEIPNEPHQNLEYIW